MQFSKAGPRSKLFNLRLTEEEFDWLHAEAKRRGVKAADVIRAGLDCLSADKLSGDKLAGGGPSPRPSPKGRGRKGSQAKASKVAGSRRSPSGVTAKVNAAAKVSPSNSQGTVQ